MDVDGVFAAAGIFGEEPFDPFEAPAEGGRELYPGGFGRSKRGFCDGLASAGGVDAAMGGLLAPFVGALPESGASTGALLIV